MDKRLRLTAAVRCYPVPVKQAKPRKGKPSGWRRLPLGGRVLVFDTETTTDAFQNLTFGAFQVREHVAGRYRLVHQGLMVGEVLQEKERRVIEGYAAARGLRVYTRAEFVSQIFYPEVYGRGTLCVGFNLPFDLSRLAERWGAGRGRWTGGFTLYLRDSKWMPPVHVRSLTSATAFIEFASYRGYERREAWGHKVFPGRFLDLRTLSLALTGKKHSLKSAGKAFGLDGKTEAEEHGQITPEYLDYNQRDVQATWELFEAAVAAWNRHPFASVPTHRPEAEDRLLITRAFSPATLGKAYLRLMRVRPRLEIQPAFSKRILGWSMAAYFGGRSECHVRRHIAPVTYLDVLSMYPTVCALMGVFAYVTADRIAVEDTTRETRALLERITLNDLYRGDAWKHFFVLAEVDPDQDALPVRAQHQEDADYQIGLNTMSTDLGLRLYYMLPDLIESKLLTGKSPRITRAWRFVADGTQVGLRPARLLGEAEVNPRSQDFFQAIIERRHEFLVAKARAETAGDQVVARRSDAVQHGLKILANSIGYGIFAEVNEQTGEATEVDVYGTYRFTAHVSREERLGKYAFAPIAALVTSGARLILAMLEVELKQRGATYAFCDTDSAAIVGSQVIVKAVRRRFTRLTPYGFGGDLLKLEDENTPGAGVTKDKHLYCYAISAKRYVLFNRADDGSIVVRKGSEHGLGHLLKPDKDVRGKWTDEAWEAIIRWALDGGQLAGSLEFGDDPAVGQAPITKPAILALFSRVTAPASRTSPQPPHAGKVKPFNFLLAAYPETGDITTGGEAYWPEEDDSPGRVRKPIRPVAPYELDREKRTRLPWTDLHTGRPVALTWRRGDPGVALGAIPVKTYRDVLRQYVTHPEAKAAGPDGHPCGPFTTGELTRLHVLVTGVVHIGKESHDLEDVQAGLTPAISTYVHYRDRQAELEELRRTLRPFRRKKLAAMTGLHPRSIKEFLNTSRVPHPRNLAKLVEAARRLTSEHEAE